MPRPPPCSEGSQGGGSMGRARSGSVGRDEHGKFTSGPRPRGSRGARGGRGEGGGGGIFKMAAVEVLRLEKRLMSTGVCARLPAWPPAWLPGLGCVTRWMCDLGGWAGSTEWPACLSACLPACLNSPPSSPSPPLHPPTPAPPPAGEIARVALKRGLIKCTGKTPEATMASALYTDIKRKEGQSIFIRPHEGLFGLREWIEQGVAFQVGGGAAAWGRALAGWVCVSEGGSAWPGLASPAPLLPPTCCLPSALGFAPSDCLLTAVFLSCPPPLSCCLPPFFLPACLPAAGRVCGGDGQAGSRCLWRLCRHARCALLACSAAPLLHLYRPAGQLQATCALLTTQNHPTRAL
jgi:hypothetical protein